MKTPFRFAKPGRLVDGELELVLVRTVPADKVKSGAPMYEFEMCREGYSSSVGRIRLYVGSARKLRLVGHMGYVVDEKHRGHRYAARSCRLLMPLAKSHGLKAVWFVMDPKNVASIRTCEILGARYVETVRLRKDDVQWQWGDRYRRRYRLGMAARNVRSHSRYGPDGPISSKT